MKGRGTMWAEKSAEEWKMMRMKRKGGKEEERQKGREKENVDLGQYLNDQAVALTGAVATASARQ